MNQNLIPIKTFLGKYYPELALAVTQDKYFEAGIGKFFEQRFHIQDNKPQMVIDPHLSGLIIIVSGNEIHVSKELYDHSNIIITNSSENPDYEYNSSKTLYNPNFFSSLAYLVCQNHTMFEVVGEIEEPIYIKYKSDFEAFYNSVVIFDIAEELNIEIVEEYESRCALNSVTNYFLQQHSKLKLTTFYRNNFSASSFNLRNVIAKESSTYNHILFGRGSATTVDETKLTIHDKAEAELLGCINPGMQEFHNIVGVHPAGSDFKFNLDQRHVLIGTGRTTFTPIIVGKLPDDHTSDVSALVIADVPEDLRVSQTVSFISPIMNRAVLDRFVGVEKFYASKAKFLEF